MQLGGLRLAALLPFVLLAGCTGVADPRGPVGRSEMVIMLDSLAIMLVIVVPTIICTLAFAWWYRASNTKATFLPDFAYSGRVELVVWSIPIMVILLLGGVTWVGSHDLDPYKPLPSSQKPLEVQVVSLDWKWLFIYPEQHIASVNRLVIPAGRPVHFSLTSASVMNTLFVPQLGGMIYTMNGMVTQLSLQADKPGIFHGQSAHFSGDGFSDMHFQTQAVTPAQFGQWAGSVAGHGPVLDAASYTQLAQQNTVAPFTFGAVQPNLFHAVATRALGSEPGPDQGKPSVAVSPRTEHANAG